MSFMVILPLIVQVYNLSPYQMYPNCPNMADIPTMYKDTDWKKVKGMSGYKIGQDRPKIITKDNNVTRPKNDGNFTFCLFDPVVAFF